MTQVLCNNPYIACRISMDEISRIKLSQLRAWSQSLFTAISVKRLCTWGYLSRQLVMRSLLLKRNWGAVTLSRSSHLTSRRVIEHARSVLQLLEMMVGSEFGKGLHGGSVRMPAFAV